MVTTVRKITRKEADEAIDFFVKAGMYAWKKIDENPKKYFSRKRDIGKGNNDKFDYVVNP